MVVDPTTTLQLPEHGALQPHHGSALTPAPHYDAAKLPALCAGDLQYSESNFLHFLFLRFDFGHGFLL